MKKSNFIIPALMATLLSGGILVATESSARPMHNAEYSDGCGGPCTGGYGNTTELNAEQQKKYDMIVEDYTKRMNPVRDQVFVKRQELSALRNATSPDVKAVREAATELTKLNGQMRDLHKQMMTQLEKETGVTFTRKGMGHGNMGKGHGNMGHGNMGQGNMGMGHGNAPHRM